jgi:AraC-like DNA-binding protein
MSDIISIDTIVKAHEMMGLSSPKHPLVSVVMPEDFKMTADFRGAKIVPGFYQVMFKLGECGTLRYGRNSYDYEDGTLIFTSPGQSMQLEESEAELESVHEGWTLAFHPDLIRNSPLADKIERYNFFQYEVTEALHLSDEERKTIEDLRDKIVVEYSQNLDRHSQNLIIANIELLLDYCLRFYDRQFITRSNLNSDLVSKFERILKGYYQSELEVQKMPSVHFCAEQLHLSANYLSDLLKKETGKTAQEHIHLFVMEKAKTRLRHGSESISEIAYSLGFEYPQHFSNLFKAKTGYSPRAYRNMA